MSTFGEILVGEDIYAVDLGTYEAVVKILKKNAVRVNGRPVTDGSEPPAPVPPAVAPAPPEEPEAPEEPEPEAPEE